LLKKINIYIVTNICDFCKDKRINNNTRDKIWILMKYILSTEYNLLKKNNLDALILSSIYAICKKQEEINNNDINSISNTNNNTNNTNSSSDQNSKNSISFVSIIKR
jgi:hypothetical protein